ncbi:MAG: GH3 auxin-responsive promoter family protein [Chitinophagaceae bacterium]|nr:GH3 auxin-responsive promoter family protein [Chitinophagaceae bacterium]
MISYFIKQILQKRITHINYLTKYPNEVQQKILYNLIKKAQKTEYGKKYGFSSIHTYSQFSSQVPIVVYEELFPYIERIMKGESNVLWNSKIQWFSKSSGTTNAKSKFIPVSYETLYECHFKGGKDLLSFYINNYPDTKVFTGKGLTIGGSQQINPLNTTSKTYYGDISAVILKNLPIWTKIYTTPTLKVALMDKWEHKIEKIAQETISQNITNISGVPTWTVILLKKILEITKKNNILEVWNNLELFVHGAVNFEPYKPIFQKLIPTNNFHYLETYNASEGFFAIQDLPESREMLLMVDYGIFYEFIETQYNETLNPKIIPLSEVELNTNYSIVITTNSGLWRYKIGDTIRFTSLNPYRIKITGRTKHYINAFGEELIIENAEISIANACEKTNAIFSNFTAAPFYFEENKKAYHEWFIEFDKEPENIELFTETLDNALKKLNSDYEAKREKDLALQKPYIHVLKKGTFYEWMKTKQKLGGQNKIPRLSNDREYVTDLFQFIQKQKNI